MYWVVSIRDEVFLDERVRRMMIVVNKDNSMKKKRSRGKERREIQRRLGKNEKHVTIPTMIPRPTKGLGKKNTGNDITGHRA